MASQATEQLPQQNGHPIDNGSAPQAPQSAQRDPEKHAPPPANKDDPKKEERSESKQEDKQPEGGFDSTPFPRLPQGYTIQITIHRARHLPIADMSTSSSDPYCRLDFLHGLPTRHKEDSVMQCRTRTVWKNTDPVWDTVWTIANAPTQGFKLKGRVYDEDSRDADDRLGNIHVTVPPLENWEGFHDKAFQIKKRSGSWRAYALRGIASCMRKEYGINGYVHLSVQVLGKTPESQVPHGRPCTLGKNYWCKNFSPLLGRITGSKEPDDDEYHDRQNEQQATATGENKEDLQTRNQGKTRPASKRKAQRYNFQSNQFQLSGPVPEELYHRYVEFRPFVKSMFTGKGIRGIILNKALHHQHTNIYNFNQDTRYGVFDEPCADMTRKFLDLAHWDQGGRIHTYVITLDGLLRFTETGKEFGIDLLSKHTMHSDVSLYIAYSGEFFIRRARSRSRDNRSPAGSPPSSPDPATATATAHPAERPAPTRLASNQSDVRPAHQDPSSYELVIDNDSGTYRPNAQLLPLLREFLQRNFPGLKITTLDCQKDAELMGKLKQQQRDRKKRDPQKIVYQQVSRSSSMSSSDEERVDALADGQERRGPTHRLGEALGPYTMDHPKARKLVGGGT